MGSGHRLVPIPNHPDYWMCTNLACSIRAVTDDELLTMGACPDTTSNQPVTRSQPNSGWLPGNLRS